MFCVILDDCHFNKWLIEDVLPMLRAWLPWYVWPFVFKCPWVWAFNRAVSLVSCHSVLFWPWTSVCRTVLSINVRLSILDRSNCQSVTLLGWFPPTCVSNCSICLSANLSNNLNVEVDTAANNRYHSWVISKIPFLLFRQCSDCSTIHTTVYTSLVVVIYFFSHL